MLLGPNDELILSDSGSRNQPDGVVYVIHEGASKKIIENLDRPFGLAFHEDRLYVAEPTSVKRYKYDAEAMTAGEGEEIIAFGDTGKGHWTRSLLFNADHSKLYVTVGSGSNIDLGEDPIRAALHRYNPDGSGHETVATGLRNVIGLQWRPGSSDLWGAVQERDGLGDDLVADYLVQIKPGGFYGWPYAYTGPNEEPRHKDVAPDMVKKSIYPDVLLGAPRRRARHALLHRRHVSRKIPRRTVPGLSRLLEPRRARRLQRGLHSLQGRPPAIGAAGLPYGLDGRTRKH